MPELSDANLTRRALLKHTATAAAVGTGVTGLGTARPAGVDVTAKIYTNGYDWQNEIPDSKGEWVRDVLEEDLVDQFTSLGINLDVEYVGGTRVMNHVDEFIEWVPSYRREDGYAIHVWVNDGSQDNSNTYGSKMVNGDGEDSFTNLQIDSITTDDADYNRNIVIHEVVHGFLNEERDDFECPHHDPSVSDDDDDYPNTSEHTCGTVKNQFGFRSYEVSPMATSYQDEPENMGDTCNGKTSWSTGWGSDFDFTRELSSCTEASVANLVANSLK